MKQGELIGHISAFLTILVWGVTFISTKILLRNFTPLEILVYRFFMGWLALWLMHPHWLKVSSLREELLFAAAGFFGITLYFLLENIALTCTLVSNVGVIVATAPFFTAILARFFLKGRSLNLNFCIGFILAMTGISLISFNGLQLHVNPVGDLLALLAALAWAVYSILTRKLALKGHGSLPSTRRIFFYGLLFMLPLTCFSDFSIDFSCIARPENLFNLLFLGIGASAICFASWTFAIKKLGAVNASVYIYLVPVVTVISAGLLLNEPFTPQTFLGSALTISGLVLAETNTGFWKRLILRIDEK